MKSKKEGKAIAAKAAIPQPSPGDLLDAAMLQSECSSLSKEDILREGQWEQEAEVKTHPKFVRFAVLASGEIVSMTVTFSSTSSDKRAHHKQKSDLLRDQYHVVRLHAGEMHAIKFIVKREWVAKNRKFLS